MNLQLGSEDRPRKRGRTVLVILALAVVGLAVWGSLRTGGIPQVVIQLEPGALGPRTRVVVVVTEPRRGLTDLTVELLQDGESVASLERRSYQPRSPFVPWAEATDEERLEIHQDWKALPGLESGEAVLRVTAGRAGTWMRSPEPVVVERTVPVRLVPPTLTVLSDQHYLTQAGSEAVVYAVGPTAVEDGVQVADRFFPGYPLPGGEPGERFALYGAPYDLFEASRIRLVARDDVGNEARTAFLDLYKPRPFQSGRIELSDGFLEKVVPPILQQTPSLKEAGNLLEDYVHINSELRRSNRAELVEMAGRSVEDFLWHEPFLQMPNAQVMSPFAVERSYFYQGREVDRQFHLGYDLATVRRDEIPAANDGVVLRAGFFGIYGNAVILDHGYGLLTLYGHLSTLGVQEGDRVRRGQTLGRSGETGLAGGDHLHFAVLLQGMPVDPREWWDGQWIRNRIGRKLGAASPLDR